MLKGCTRAFSLIQCLLGHQSHTIPSSFSSRARRRSEKHSSTCDFCCFDGGTTCESFRLFQLGISNPDQVYIQADSSRVVLPVVRECFILQDEILRHLSPEALQQRPRLADSSQQPTLSSLAFCSALYSLDVPTSISRNHSTTPLVFVVEHSFAFSQICAQVAVRQRDVSSSLRTSYSRALSLLGKLVELAENVSDAPFEISWHPSTWASDVLDSLDVEVRISSLVSHSRLSFIFRTSISIWWIAAPLFSCHSSGRLNLSQSSSPTKDNWSVGW